MAGKGLQNPHRRFDSAPRLQMLLRSRHTMVLAAACLGLRASEIMGLQWRDFNYEDLTVLIQRGVVNGRAGDTKTEASQKPLPIDPRLACSLKELWQGSSYKSPQDWVFSNRAGRPRAFAGCHLLLRICVHLSLSH